MAVASAICAGSVSGNVVSDGMRNLGLTGTLYEIFLTMLAV
jgi:hypothetical protein